MNVCKDYNYCCIKMLVTCDKILKFNQEHISQKIQFVIYADMESLLKW